jgi:hypothetical protein
VERRGKGGADRGCKLGRDALVGIQAQDPVVHGLRHGEILLWPEAEPRLLDHPRAAAAGDFYGMIATAGIDDDCFGCERRRSQSLGEIRAGVASDHHEGQGKRGKQIGHRVERRRAATSGLQTPAGRRGPFYVQTYPQSTRRRLS